MPRELPRCLLLMCGLLPPGAAVAQEVRGVVRDFAGPGLSNIVVRAMVYDSMNVTQFVAATDASGAFAFPAQLGSWSVAVDAPSLNAIGYLSAGSASLTVSNESKAVRFTTRKLDLSRRVRGVLKDEWQFPLSGVAMWAFLHENGRSYSTNFATGLDGGFSFMASPAIWSLPLPGTWTSPPRVFPDLSVSIEPADSEKTVMLIAPRVTANIFGVAGNLAGCEVRAECEAHGNRYAQTYHIGGASEAFSLPVFNGVWTVSVTNRNIGFRGEPFPAPVVVAVTNQSVEIRFDRLPVVRRTLEVKIVTAAGESVTNAFIYASSVGGFSSVTPLPLPNPPSGDGARLQLAEGRWRVSASTTGPQPGTDWYMTREVVISGSSDSNLTLVVPAAGSGPRIVGVARDSNGDPLPERPVTFRATEQGTNYSSWAVTDANGAFAVRVVPGRWAVALLDSTPCSVVATTRVVQADQEVELIVCPQVQRTNVPVRVTVVDEAEPPDVDLTISVSNWSNFFQTNGAPAQPVFIPLNFGLWDASLSRNWSVLMDDPYHLYPSLKFQHDETGPTDLILVARQASARIEARLRDAQGRLLTAGYVSARANIGGTNYSVTGQMTSGYFSLNVIPGDWEVAVSTWWYPSLGPFAVASGAPRAPDYADPPRRVLRVTNGVTHCEFVVDSLPVPVPLTVSVIREDGMDLDGVFVQVSGNSSPGPFLSGTSGVSQFSVRPGTNVVSASWDWDTVVWEDLLFPSLAVNIPPGTSSHLVLVARVPTACVRGTAADVLGQPVPLLVNAWCSVGGTNYYTSACPRWNGEYCLPVFPGDWEIAVQEDLANDSGFRSPPGQHVHVPSGSPPPGFDFVLEPFAGDFRHAKLSNPVITPAGETQFELRAQASLTWRIERSEDLSEWRAVSQITSTNGVARISDLEAWPVRARFYRAVWVE